MLSLLEALRNEAENKLSKTRLRVRLKWDDGKYEEALAAAKDGGYVQIGRGGGGGVIALTTSGSDLISLVCKLHEQFGGRTGNKALRSSLGWNDDRYKDTVEHAVQNELVRKGPGQGGSLRITAKEWLSRKRTEADAAEFLRVLRDDLSGRAGNKALRDKLSWEADRYWTVRRHLMEHSLVIKGRGQGGSVAIPDDDVEKELDRQPRTRTSKEGDLYEPALKVIQGDWAKESIFEHWLAKRTAYAGKKDTGGKWTRPDITVLAARKYKLPPRRRFEIITFEIKQANAVSVDGVFEALAHKQAAHRSYLLFERVVGQEEGERQNPSKNESLDRVLEVARKFGIGVIAANDIADYYTWEVLVEPSSVAPDLEKAEAFVVTQFGESAIETVQEWFDD